MNNIPLYKEIQGAMTQFEPLTEAVVQKAAEDGLTISEVKAALEKRGLDLKYIVHDPSRTAFHTYYADYDRGLYGDIFFQRNMLDGALPLYGYEEKLKGNAVPQLVTKEWRSYYEICVPLPMLIYDFQRR